MEGRWLVRKDTLTLQIRHSPAQQYDVSVSPIPENILGIDILQGHSLQISRDEFCLHVRITKVLSGITN